MKNISIDQQKEKLIQKKQLLEQQLIELVKLDPGEDENRLFDNDPEDDGQEAEAGSRNAAQRRAVTQQLGRINRALEKIEVGTYGICDMTGEKIDPDRLRAIPEAIYTIEAEEKLEASR